MAQPLPHLHVVLLADDYGEELWPLARAQAPACLAPAHPGMGDSLLSATVGRVRDFTEYPLHVITTDEMSDLVCRELVTHGGVQAGSIDMIALPVRHGSAFSLALALATIRRGDPDAVVMTLPANQSFEVDERWDNLVYHAYQIALRDRIVLVGAQQDECVGGTGHIRLGQQFENIDGSYEVRLFTPEARLAAAQRAVREGALWFTGIFMGRAACLVGAYGSAGEASARIAETAGFLAMLERSAWKREEAVSLVEALPDACVDQAVLASASGLVALPLTAHIAGLSSLADLDVVSAPDGSGNRCFGAGCSVVSHDVTSFEQEPGRMVCALGVDDVVVVDTADMVLVAGKRALGQADELRGKLRDNRAPQLDAPVRRIFAWGTAQLLVSTDTSATFALELRSGAQMEPCALPFEYGSFAAHEKTAQMTMRVQCTVADGYVELTHSDESEPSDLAGPADSFEMSASHPLSVTCDESGPALLIMTAVVDS